MKFSSYSEMSRLQYLRYIMVHPVDGYQELKFNKKLSVKLAAAILSAWVLIACFDRLYTNYVFNPFSIKNFNFYMVVFSTVGLFFLAVISNWGFCTLMDGKGTFKEIFVCGSYALVPYLVCKCAVIILGQFLTAEEGIFLTYILYFGMIWSFILLLFCLQVIHDYSTSKTIASMLLTVLGMLIIIFFGVLLLSLFQQIWMFISTVYIEITSRA